jgi:hypothetical protein
MSARRKNVGIILRGTDSTSPLPEKSHSFDAVLSAVHRADLGEYTGVGIQVQKASRQSRLEAFFGPTEASP